jgi:hypothetical protein
VPHDQREAFIVGLFSPPVYAQWKAQDSVISTEAQSAQRRAPRILLLLFLPHPPLRVPHAQREAQRRVDHGVVPSPASNFVIATEARSRETSAFCLCSPRPTPRPGCPCLNQSIAFASTPTPPRAPEARHQTSDQPVRAGQPDSRVPHDQREAFIVGLFSTHPPHLRVLKASATLAWGEAPGSSTQKLRARP